MTRRSPVNTGDILKSQYEVKQKFGEGGFGAVYEIYDRKRNLEMAIKVELQRPTDDEPGLEMEIGVIKRLQNSKHIARFIDEGKLGPFRYFIMQLLGKNLGDLRVCNPKYRFTTSTSTRVASQCFEAIQDLHRTGILHRDIKPANFAIGRTAADVRNIYILEFSTVRTFLSKDGSLRAARPIVGFVGTARYASINAHKNYELGRHDDIWSWLYMIIEMHQGDLPWRVETNKEKIGEMKEKLSRHKLLLGMEPEYHHIYEYLRTLKYEQQPKYDWIQQCLIHIMQRRKIQPKDPFDWEEGGVGFDYAKRVQSQPFAKQMRARDKIVKEKLKDQQPEEELV